ncbi:hypothetical protein J3459_008017 [Metarhizium acridum]|uniref:uncharacterized protein n=1 Tax=Metarhizium acridum TaxID=92637 RepID=UPI001C6B3CA6|nr:hypothetical protein J3458_000856 [Metarhizium acridum]KAG8426538.1 hypothetical protein J3459_008017 [Metarhizium acridum]
MVSAVLRTMRPSPEAMNRQPSLYFVVGASVSLGKTPHTMINPFVLSFAGGWDDHVEASLRSRAIQTHYCKVTPTVKAYYQRWMFATGPFLEPAQDRVIRV